MSVLYQNLGVVDCTNEFDTGNVAGKTAIVTGGRSQPQQCLEQEKLTFVVGGGGMGAAYVRALAKAGYANVTFAITKASAESSPW